MISIPEIDTAAGLLRTGGNESNYNRVLITFCARYDNLDAEIGKLNDSGKTAEIAFLLHDISGVAGNIGAESLSEKARSLLSILKVMPQNEGLHPVIVGDVLEYAAEISALCVKIKQELGEKSEDAEKSIVSEEDFKTLYRELIHHSQNAEIAVIEKFENFLKSYDLSDYQGTIARIKPHVQKLDFKNIIKEAESLHHGE